MCEAKVHIPAPSAGELQARACFSRGAAGCHIEHERMHNCRGTPKARGNTSSDLRPRVRVHVDAFTQLHTNPAHKLVGQPESIHEGMGEGKRGEGMKGRNPPGVKGGGFGPKHDRNNGRLCRNIGELLEQRYVRPQPLSNRRVFLVAGIASERRALGSAFAKARVLEMLCL